MPTFTSLAIIDVLGVRAVGYERSSGDWEVVESQMPGLVSFGQRAASSTVRIVASPGDGVIGTDRRRLTFSHMMPGSAGWVAMVSDGSSFYATDPFRLESA